jgi:hypothetical protein
MSEPSEREARTRNFATCQEIEAYTKRLCVPETINRVVNSMTRRDHSLNQLDASHISKTPDLLFPFFFYFFLLFRTFSYFFILFSKKRQKVKKK